MFMRPAPKFGCHDGQQGDICHQEGIQSCASEKLIHDFWVSPQMIGWPRAARNPFPALNRPILGSCALGRSKRRVWLKERH